MVCGIYKIVNKVNGRYYVGSSKDILGARWPQHQRELRDRTHHNSHLTNAWHRYGRDNFEIVVVEEVPEARLYEVEQRYPNECAAYPDLAYNLNYAPDGGRPSPESIEKIRQKLKGRVFTEQHRSRIGLANTGRLYSQETRRKIGRFSTARVHGLDVRRRISASLTGQRRTEETRARQSASGIGKHDHTGVNNPRFDSTIHGFVHCGTGERFDGTRFEFISRFELSSGMVSEMVRGKRGMVKGWAMQTAMGYGH